MIWSFQGIFLLWIELIWIKGSKLRDALVTTKAIAASTVRKANHGPFVSRLSVSLEKMFFALLQESFQLFF